MSQTMKRMRSRSPASQGAGLALALMALMGLAGCENKETARPDRQTGKVYSFYIETQEDALALSHDGKLGIRPMPEGVRPVQANGLAFISQVRDENGDIVGVASELEDFSVSGGPAAGEAWDTYWTIVILGRGALFLHEQERLDTELVKIFSETRGGTADWTGEHVGASNVGPSPDGYGVVIGGTGEFDGATGVFEEIGTLRRFSTTGVLDARIELRVQLNPPS